MIPADESRDEVVARLAERLTEPSTDGGGPSVVLRGPAGIGKSHIAREVAARLEADGHRVRRVAGGEAQRRLAFGAVLHLLGASAEPVAVEFELIQRLRAALVGTAERDAGGHTVLVIDDVGLLDDRSAGLIESVVLQGDVVVLATERTPLAGLPREHFLTSLLQGRAEFVDVPPMVDSELAELLVDWAGPGEIGSMRRLCEMAQGNPLVLRELYTTAKADGAIGERSGLWYLGDVRLSGYSLERLVTEHLDRRSEGEWELLRCLAVAGSLPRHLASRLDSTSLQQLERDGLLRDDPVEISHPLYSEVTVATLSSDQIRDVCAKLVGTVGPGDDVDAARLGSWLLRAEHAVDDAVARRGAALALARWENDLARRLLETIPEPTVADFAQLIWAHANDGRTEEAAEAADRAVAAASSDEERVMAGLARAELWALQMGRRDDAYRALAELRATLDNPVLIAKVDGATALYSNVTGNRELAVSAARSAVEQVDVEDPSVRLAIIIGDAFGKVFHGEFHAAGPEVAEGIALAEQLDERHNWVRLKIVEALRHLLLGELASSRRVVSEMLRLADVAGVRPAHVVWLGLDAQMAQIAGDYALAEHRAREAVRAGDHVDDFGAAGFVRGDLAALMIELGRSTDLDVGSSPIGLARARIRLAPLDEVDELAARLATETHEAGYGLWAPWVAREAVRRLPAPRSADALAEWAAELDGPVVACFAEHAAGAVDGDVGRVRAAAATLEGLGFTMPALDARVTAAELLVADEVDVTVVRRLLLRVRAMAEGVRPGLPPAVASRLAVIAERVEMPTERQLEIADLAAAGLASKEIASRLVVSVRTVDNHLAAVYRHLGVNNRDDLAAILRDGADPADR